MANFEIPEKPEYSEEIRKFEEEDPGHADLFNAVVETLLNNEVFLKKLADSLAKSISGLNTLTKYTTVQTPNPSMGAQIVQKENTELDMETGLPFPFPIQEVVAGHELALRQLNTDTKLQKSTSGTYLCFFKAVDGARVVLFIPLPSPVEENKNYKLGNIRVWANNPMGTQNTFSLTGRGKNGLCFESTNDDVIYKFFVLLNDHMCPGTAELTITP